MGVKRFALLVLKNALLRLWHGSARRKRVHAFRPWNAMWHSFDHEMPCDTGRIVCRVHPNHHRRYHRTYYSKRTYYICAQLWIVLDYDTGISPVGRLFYFAGAAARYISLSDFSTCLLAWCLHGSPPREINAWHKSMRVHTSKYLIWFKTKNRKIQNQLVSAS